jgi:hypothetical protein
MQAAAEEGHLKVVQTLLAANADIMLLWGTVVRLRCRRLPRGATSRLWRSLKTHLLHAVESDIAESDG